MLLPLDIGPLDLINWPITEFAYWVVDLLDKSLNPLVITKYIQIK